MKHCSNKYTVVIPTLGRWKYLADLLPTVLSQTVPPKEVLILLDPKDTYNDGELLAFKQNFLSSESKITVIHTNRNLAGKRNLGVELSSTDYIFFSDDDDIWHSDKAAQCLKELKEYAVVTHNFSKFGDVNKVQCSFLGVYDTDITLSARLPGDNVYGGGSSIAARRSVLVNFLFKTDLAYCEDLDWWLRIIADNILIRYIGSDLVSYRSHSSNMTTRNFLIFRYTLLVAWQLSLTSPLMLILCTKIIFRATAKFVYKSMLL